MSRCVVCETNRIANKSRRARVVVALALTGLMSVAGLGPSKADEGGVSFLGAGILRQPRRHAPAAWIFVHDDRLSHFRQGE